jgi:LacI family transcriptional regulator
MNDILRSPDQKKKKIALVFWPKVGNQHLHLIGIRQFAAGFSHWIWKGFAPENSAIPAIRAWKPDGIIGMLETPELAHACRRMRVPAVDVGDRLDQQPCFQVCVDHGKIGEVAANYFLERRFQSFAFCGVAGAHFATERQRGFERTLQNAGRECHTTWFKPDYGVPKQSAAWVEPAPGVARWLAKLPKPLALMVSNDQLGLAILSACGDADMRVPDDIAILGVDDDELMCTMANPPLSSIPIPAKRIGYEAASELAAMMAGYPQSDGPLILPPLPIVPRASTERMAASDPDVRKALELIGANAGQRFCVQDIADRLAVHRRTLERKFHRELSTGIQDEINRSRIQKAQLLLKDTDLSIAAIASKSGFVNRTRFGVLFRHHTGTTPATYRRQFRAV